jgi:hypothetical protein
MRHSRSSLTKFHVSGVIHQKMGRKGIVFLNSHSKLHNLRHIALFVLITLSPRVVWLKMCLKFVSILHMFSNTKINKNKFR